MEVLMSISVRPFSQVPVPPSPRRFAGRWLLGVAAIHTIFALVVFWGELVGMVRDGFLNVIGEDPMRGAVAWFVLFGGALAFAAVAVDELEARGAPLRRSGWALLAFVALGIGWMPVSGFWLALPAIVTMLRYPEAASRAILSA
jgi:hypothetical protein